MQNLNKKKQKHTSHITPRTSQRGITLIALIITIIVMLILVGVTINVALNGGLFDKADTATRQTEEKAILEEMLAMMVIEDNGKFNPDTIIANMRNKHPEYQIDDSNKPNITIQGKLGTYKYIVSETEIKIGSKEIKAFEWKDVGLTVELDTDYRFDDPNSGTEYIINFTEKGELILKEDGTTVRTYNAKEYIEDGKIIIPFTYAYTGKTYDTTLTMNSDGINVDATLLGLGTVTYEKVVPVVEHENPIVYTVEGGSLAENGGIVEISAVECKRIAGSYIMPGEIIYCSDINKLMPDGYEFDNTGIEYTKVAWDNKRNQPLAVYSTKDNGWITPSVYNNTKYYIEEGTPVCNSKTTITRDQLNEITKDLTEI